MGEESPPSPISIRRQADSLEFDDPEELPVLPGPFLRKERARALVGEMQEDGHQHDQPSHQHQPDHGEQET